MRPLPPDDIIENTSVRFEPALDLLEWARSTFIDETADLVNEDHAHLRVATIGMLWTNVENGRNGRRIIGQCEMGLPPAGKWQRARIELQLTQWFGDVPDFVLTFDAHYASICSDAEFCALVEHELYHAGQERDAFGAPKFRKMSGLPAFTIRGHDVEEFVGVVRRYGADAAGVRAMVDAANQPPEISRANIGHVCGTCHLRVA
ncbi:putative metallopeptidase [Rhizobium sp. CNPSo 3968]|uniref:putative metallopeptidase n=1 Tax=Rhizobium sp. CNPSo 3968 TaxID=3021408 RepID=UPI00254AE3A7|nr:putative metallopeptidase [Rhizobium sp. CNPSo 3968]MDK4720118.1 putative metallopeptidase [Rhizobium sp. CNPSo 3968]